MRNLIIDGNNRFISAYIVNPMITSNGVPVGGINGFFRSLQKCVREVKPDRIFIVWDGTNGSVRRRRTNPNYKAGRKPLSLNRSVDLLTEEEKEQNKIWQQIKIIEYSEHLPVIQLCIDDLEADDVIGFLCKELKFEEKVLVSSDKDFYQLLDDKTIIYRPTQKEWVDKNDLVTKLGIYPSNIALARAIEGDKSDDLGGIDGVGLKTVLKRFEAFGEEKKLDLNYIKEFCEQECEKKKPLKVYKKILDGIDLIKENYILMQLEEVNISFVNQQRVRSIMSNFNYHFNKSAFMIQYSRDGLTNFEVFSNLMMNCMLLSQKFKQG